MKTYKIVHHRKGCDVQIKIRRDTPFDIIGTSNDRGPAHLRSSSDPCFASRNIATSAAATTREGRSLEAQ